MPKSFNQGLHPRAPSDPETAPAEAPYPLVPQLDWLRDLADEMESFDDGKGNTEDLLAERLRNLYRYNLWSRRYALINSGVDRQGSEICSAFLTKYHRLVFDIPATVQEQELIEKGYKMHKARLAHFRATRR